MAVPSLAVVTARLSRMLRGSVVRVEVLQQDEAAALAGHTQVLFHLALHAGALLLVRTTGQLAKEEPAMKQRMHY